MSSSSVYVPNLQSQMRYLLEWFAEFSEMQKGDFLPLLVQRFGNKCYVNGILPGMEAMGNFEERPPSLFQCRMKLFMEWTDGWSQQDKDRLLQQIKDLDPSFASKYEKETDSDVKSNSSEDHNINNDDCN